jgi:uncharacterized secreted protein with C-terminal beta-propeller domain
MHVKLGTGVPPLVSQEKDLTREKGLAPFDVFATSPQLQNEFSTGLIDTGAQVLLVGSSSSKKSTPKGKYRDINVNIQGVNGGDMHITKGIMLQVNGKKMFYVVDSLPRNIDLILSQEWLLQNGYMMTCPFQ